MLHATRPRRSLYRTVLAVMLGAGLLISAEGAPQTVPVGGEFVLNGFTDGTQSSPAVGGQAGGEFVVVWRASQPYFYPGGPTPVPNAGVFGQRFDLNGDRVGGEFQVNTTPVTEYRFVRGPQVEVGTAGNFVVTWWDSYFGSYGWAYWGNIRTQQLDSDANLVGPEIDLAIGRTPDVGLADDGRFVIVWTGGSTDGTLARAQSFAADGTPVSSLLELGKPGNEKNENAAVAMDATGNFIVVWATGPFDTTQGVEILGHRFQADGTSLSANFVVNTHRGVVRTTPTSPPRPAVPSSSSGPAATRTATTSASSVNASTPPASPSAGSSRSTLIPPAGRTAPRCS